MGNSSSNDNDVLTPYEGEIEIVEPLQLHSSLKHSHDSESAYSSSDNDFESCTDGSDHWQLNDIDEDKEEAVTDKGYGYTEENFKEKKWFTNSSTEPKATYFLPDLLTLSNNCEIHEEQYEFFCRDHDCLICQTCKDSNHSECTDAPHIEDVTRIIKDSVCLEDAFEKTREFLELYRVALNDRRKERQLLQNDRIECPHAQNQSKCDALCLLCLEIRSDKMNIDRHLLELIRELDGRTKVLEEILRQENDIKTHSSNRHIFICIKFIEKTVFQYGTYLESLYTKKLMNKYSHLYEDTIGMFGIEAQSIENEKDNAMKAMELLYMPPSHDAISIAATTPLSLKLESKIHKSFDTITGCCMVTESGLVVVGQERNTDFVLIGQQRTTNFIKFLDLDSAFTSTHRLSVMHVFDVAQIDDHSVVISGGYTGFVYIFDREISKIFQVLYTGKAVGGIAYADSIVFSTTGQGILGFDYPTSTVDNILSRLICADVNLSKYSHVAAMHDLICYTVPKTNTVKGISLTGKVIFEIRDLSLLIEPRGVIIDRFSNVFVASFASGTLYMIPHDRSGYFKLLDSDTLRAPQAICCDNEMKRLVVINGLGDISVYSINYS